MDETLRDKIIKELTENGFAEDSYEYDEEEAVL